MAEATAVLREVLARWFARPRRLSVDGWRVVVNRGGRAGDGFYEEAAGRLGFEWELLSRGLGVTLPTSFAWDDACASRGTPWAAGRRDEIVGRIAAEVRRLEAPSARLAMGLDGFDLLF